MLVRSFAASRMSKTGKPFSPTSDFANNRPVALPDLLAGLMNNASLGEVQADTEGLVPEVMAPEEEMPLATPVNASMPEFLQSLRTLLSSYEDGSQVLAPELPSEAVQDFAHGTNELLNYLLHEVVGAAAPAVEAYGPEAAHDFADDTNELLNYLLSQVAEPVISDDTVYTAEAMADFQAGTQDLLSQLLMMADAQEAPPPVAFVAEECPLVIDVEPVREPEPLSSLDGLLGDLLADALRETLEPEPVVLEPPVEDEVTAQGLLTGLLAGLTGGLGHNLGEVPAGYIDESDDVAVERPAGPFELLLDVIDAELPPPPAVHRGAQPAATAASADERFIAFELSTESYALPFNCVLETDRVLRWTHVPAMPAHIRGVLNLRGEIIPLVDLRALFGFGPATADGRMIIVRHSGGKMNLAFVVDRLLGLAAVPPADIKRTRGDSVVGGVASASGRRVGLIDPDRVIAAAHGDHVLPRHTILTNHLEEQSYV